MNRENTADILYSSFIRYDRMYEMTKYAFYGKTDATCVNIYIDCYSILRSLYTRGSNIAIKDSYSIASCLINLAIHIRAYFETRHQVPSMIYLIYGGGRSKEAFVNVHDYNASNILMEDSNYPLYSLIEDNFKVMKLLCPYLYDIFFICDRCNEFGVIVSDLIDTVVDKFPNIVYSKDPLSYQLVAFKPYTFLYRPKKSSKLGMVTDDSWVVTKSSLYNAYRYAELGTKTKFDTALDPKMFSMVQAMSGVKSRNIKSFKNINSTIQFLENSLYDFIDGYTVNTIYYSPNNIFVNKFGEEIGSLLTKRFAAIDIPFQTQLYQMSINSKENKSGIINLTDPEELKHINNVYFTEYPLDLNRV